MGKYCPSVIFEWTCVCHVLITWDSRKSVLDALVSDYRSDFDSSKSIDENVQQHTEYIPCMVVRTQRPQLIEVTFMAGFYFDLVLILFLDLKNCTYVAQLTSLPRIHLN